VAAWSLKDSSGDGKRCGFGSSSSLIRLRAGSMILSQDVGSDDVEIKPLELSQLFCSEYS
jgi:hypothetical protein